MLALAILDHEPTLGVVGVDRERPPSSVPAWIADQPWESVLAKRTLVEQLVADVKHIALVAIAHALNLRSHHHQRGNSDPE
jgi:hypothetical protein